MSAVAARRKAKQPTSGEVKDEIHRLECYLVETPRLFREQRLRDRNRVEAPKGRREQVRAGREAAPMTRVRAAAVRRERFKNMFTFFGLLILLYFVVSWVFYQAHGG